MNKQRLLKIESDLERVAGILFDIVHIVQIELAKEAVQ